MLDFYPAHFSFFGISLLRATVYKRVPQVLSVEGDPNFA